MSTRVEFLDYKIHLTDTALLATLQAQVQAPGRAPGTVILAPDTAATTYHAPILAPAEPFVAPCITSAWFAAGNSFPTNVPHFERKSGGLFGISWLFGKKVSYYWHGTFVLAPHVGTPVEGGTGIPAPISQRRWIDGFENIGLGLGGATSGVGSYARAASRHVSGHGLMGQVGTVAQTHLVADYAALTPTRSWERFYVRASVYPTVNETIWKTSGTVEALTGVALGLTTLGQMTLSVANNVGTQTLIGTAGAALARHRWYRVDVLFEYGAAAKAQLFIDGVLVLNVAVISPGTGMGTGGRTHLGSALGGPSTGVLHYDDWLCADWPATLDGLDWVNGSHIQKVSLTGFDAGANNWVGDYRLALQDPVEGAAFQFTSSTNAGRLGFMLDNDPIDTEPNSLGIIAGVWSVYSYRGSTGNGQVHGDLQAGAITFGGAIVQQASPTLTWGSVMWRPLGLTEAQTLGVATINHTKAADTGGAKAVAFSAVVESLGVFGDEDRPADKKDVATLGPALGIHNAPYPRTPWAQRGVPPQAPVVIHSGTYAGNDTGQELLFRVPVHWLFIRPVTGDNGGVRWWSSMLGAHYRTQGACAPWYMPEAGISRTFVPGSLPETVSSGDHSDLVARVKADLVAAGTDLSGDCGAFAIVKRVAWQLRNTGGGLLDKPTGANCQGYATDIICYADGSIFDVLVNAGTDNTPAWQVAGAGTVDPSRFRPAIDPGDDVPPTPGGSQQQQTIVRLVGNDAQNNAVGVTYHYLAIGDPGMRFMVNGALDGNRGAIDIESPLPHPTFLADGGFYWRESVSDPGFGFWFYKGPGAAAASVTPLAATADLANAITVAAGLLTSKSAFHAVDAQQMAFALFRRNDGSNDVGVARVVCIQSHIGDGSGTRSIALLPASGRRPLFAIITPHDANQAIFRDASHTGTTSSLIDGTANAATGIIAGAIDSLTVGIALNATGVVYDVFVTFGGTDACNNGWGCDGEYIPVDPIPPPDGPWDPAPTDPDAPPGPGPEPEPEPEPTLPPDFQGQCLVATTKLVNLAISRLGQSVQVVDLATELTPAAVQARLHYVEALEATLRDFPWPFATRYATLVLVAGTATVPVNGDWQYAYRAPADLLFARRFVKPGREGRGYDPAPTAFREGSDATGKLIYSGALPADARLEYTARVTCAATQGDADFRSAFGWRLAHELAPTLCRDEKKVVNAWAMYERQIGRAKTVAANESQPDQQSPDAPWITERD